MGSWGERSYEEASAILLLTTAIPHHQRRGGKEGSETPPSCLARFWNLWQHVKKDGLVGCMVGPLSRSPLV